MNDTPSHDELEIRIVKHIKLLTLDNSSLFVEIELMGKNHHQNKGYLLKMI